MPRKAVYPKCTPEGRRATLETALTSREFRHQSGPWLKEWAAEQRDARVFAQPQQPTFVGKVRRRAQVA